MGRRADCPQVKVARHDVVDSDKGDRQCLAYWKRACQTCSRGWCRIGVLFLGLLRGGRKSAERKEQHGDYDVAHTLSLILCITRE